MKVLISFLFLLLHVTLVSASEKSLSELPEPEYCGDTNLNMYFKNDGFNVCYLVFNTNESEITVKLNGQIVHLQRQSKKNYIYQSKDKKTKITFNPRMVEEGCPEGAEVCCAGEDYCCTDTYRGTLILESPKSIEKYSFEYGRGVKSN